MWLVVLPRLAGHGAGRHAPAIMSLCAGQVKRVSLELGGKSAAIVGEDADVAGVVPGLGRELGPEGLRSFLEPRSIGLPASLVPSIALNE